MQKQEKRITLEGRTSREDNQACFEDHRYAPVATRGRDRQCVNILFS